MTNVPHGAGAGAHSGRGGPVMPGEVYSKEHVTERAISFILDDSVLAFATDTRAEMILGRKPNMQKDEDEEWWEAKTKAVDELLQEMRAMNGAKRDH